MITITIYHNSNCSKSRQALAILQQQHADINIIDYLNNPPKPQELVNILNMLQIPIRNLIRHNEAVYKEKNLSNLNLSETDLIAAICQWPQLLQRPIVTNGIKAIIARPPEKVLDIL
jgi:arsenate reductase (glutaredoxin)